MKEHGLKFQYASSLFYNNYLCQISRSWPVFCGKDVHGQFAGETDGCWLGKW